MPAPVASSDPTFLQDQVMRLSAELARQQGKPASPDASAADAAWLSNSSELPPLLQV